MEGGCQCGYVRYRISSPIQRLVVCHCRDCQRQSGSAFGMSLFVSAEAFELAKGDVKTFEVLSDSGRTKTCAFCPNCGVRIYHDTETGKSIKAGTLDDTSGLTPSAHFWITRKQQWLNLPEDTRTFPDDA